MNSIWKCIERLDRTVRTKNNLFMMIISALSAAAGLIVWTAGGRLILPGADMLLVFILLPAVVMWFTSIAYIYNHSFS